MKKRSTDILIIGQGLAGSVLWETLAARGVKAMVVDNHFNDSSSKVAGGLVIPVIFKRLTKSWNADVLVPYSRKFFQKNGGVISEVDYYRLLGEERDYNDWAKRRLKEEEPNYFKEIIQKVDQGVNLMCGAGRVQDVFAIDVPKYLEEVEQKLVSAELKIKGVASIEGSTCFVADEAITFNKVVFCEGSQAVRNPLWDWLPFKLVKGETLLLDVDANINKAYSRGVFVRPKPEGLFVGATYNWKDLYTGTTEEGKAYLTGKVDKILNCKYRVIDHQSGVRPTISDRRPVIGTHPENADYVVFNGLGTKGVMIAPFYANQLVDFLLSNEALEPEVNVARFLRHFADK